MTLNLSLVTEEVAICVTDRRLSAPAGGIVSERGNKLTAFTCQNARGFITYTGIGRDDTGRSPDDWIVENPLLPTLPFDQFVEAMKKMADQRLGRLAAQGHDVRHSFVLGGFVAGTPVAVMISNFETLGEDGHRAAAYPQLSVSYCLPTPGAPTSTLIVATGDIPFDRKGRIEQIGRLAKKGAKPGELRAKTTRLLRESRTQRIAETASEPAFRGSSSCVGRTGNGYRRCWRRQPFRGGPYHRTRYDDPRFLYRRVG
nr:MAG: hypothetical protein EDM05_29080 [Leptolyngbya sp. IPPAS B-1204]